MSAMRASFSSLRPVLTLQRPLLSVSSVSSLSSSLSSSSSSSSLKQVCQVLVSEPPSWNSNVEHAANGCSNRRKWTNSSSFDGRAVCQQSYHTIARGLSIDDDEKRAKREQHYHQHRQLLRSLQVIVPNHKNSSGGGAMMYHTSGQNDKAVAIILTLGAISAGSYAASSAVKAWKEYKASLPPPGELEKDENTTRMKATDNSNAQEQQQQQNYQQQETTQQQTKSESNTNTENRENIFKKWFGVDVGTKYYEGGFEDVMTRREAALILGVRETSSTTRIKAAHRKLLVMNHPDTGGSTYIAGKINEAKELLLKGKGKL